jgi:hypothetical protein
VKSLSLIGLAAVVVLAALALAGCGDDDGGAETTAQADSEYIERGNAICRQGRREAQRLGRAGLERFQGTEQDLDLITEAFVKPGIPLLESQGAKMRKLADEADDPALTGYAELYDPAIELTRQRVAAARKGDVEKAQQLTQYTEELGVDARLAAREAGLDDCDLDFQRVVVHAAAGG